MRPGQSSGLWGGFGAFAVSPTGSLHTLLSLRYIYFLDESVAGTRLIVFG